MCCYLLQEIPLDLSHPITGSLASQYVTPSVIGGGPIYSVKMLRSIAFLNWIYNRDYNRKCAQKKNFLKKELSDGPSVNLRPLFHSNTTKVSVIKWSQNCTRTIRSGVVGIPKYLKNACKAYYFNIFGYAKNTTSDGSSSILRPLYNIYFCHITIEKWSQIWTRTIRNGFFQGYSAFGAYFLKFNCKFRPWRSWAIMLKFFCGWSVHQKKQ